MLIGVPLIFSGHGVQTVRSREVGQKKFFSFRNAPLIEEVKIKIAGAHMEIDPDRILHVDRERPQRTDVVHNAIS